MLTHSPSKPPPQKRHQPRLDSIFHSKPAKWDVKCKSCSTWDISLTETKSFIEEAYSCGVCSLGRQAQITYKSNCVFQETGTYHKISFEYSFAALVFWCCLDQTAQDRFDYYGDGSSSSLDMKIQSNQTTFWNNTTSNPAGQITIYTKLWREFSWKFTPNTVSNIIFARPTAFCNVQI